MNSNLVRQALYREHLGRGNCLRFRALGSSMWPWMRSGDLVHVSPAERLSVGDIVLYERGQEWFVHRLIRVEGTPARPQRLILRGDGLPAEDAPVGAEQVLGRVFMIERGSRRIRLDSLPNRVCKALCRTPAVHYALLVQAYRHLGRVKRLLSRLAKRVPIGG